MRRKLFLLSLILGMALFAIVVTQAKAQVLFFANFDDGETTVEGVKLKAFPDASVNEPANWKPTKDTVKWQIANFPNGTKGLKQMTEGCGNSGNTPLPDPKGVLKNLTDFTFEMEFAQGDDDSFAIHFRQTAPDKGYALLLGTKETPRVILALLDKGCSKDGQCWSDNCENGNFIKDAAHGLTFDINAGKTGTGKFYKAKLEVKGDNIKLSYGEPGQLKTLLDVKDSTHKSGSIGIFHESNSNSMIDNVLIYGPKGLVAVEPAGKLATSWGKIKTEF